MAQDNSHLDVRKKTPLPLVEPSDEFVADPGHDDYEYVAGRGSQREGEDPDDEDRVVPVVIVGDERDYEEDEDGDSESGEPGAPHQPTAERHAGSAERPDAEREEAASREAKPLP